MERVGGESLEALGIEETLGHVHGSGVRVQLDAVAELPLHVHAAQRRGR